MKSLKITRDRARVLTAIVLPLMVSIAIVTSGCEQAPKLQREKLLVFGTILDITLYDISRTSAKQAFTTLRDEFEEMHRNWHSWEPSPLTELNDAIARGEAHRVHPSLIPLLLAGQQLFQQSSGLFNPAIGQLLNIWGFQSSERPNGPPPPQTKLAELVTANPGMDDLTITGDKVSSSNRTVKLDLGGYAKGYAIDLAVARLKQLGIRNAIVNAGGDLRAIGTKGGEPWRIGVRHPQGEGVLATIAVSGDESVYTSGNYVRYNEYEGVRYAHILDPRSGLPVQGITSVTVIHSDGATADAASTALVVAGSRDWVEIARRMNVRYVMLVEESGVVHMNPAMADRVIFEAERPENIRLSPPI